MKSASPSPSFLRRNFLDRSVGALPLKTALHTHPQESLSRALETLGAHKLGCLTVLEKDGALVGLLSERDLITRAFGQGRKFADTRVADVMTKDVVTLPHYATVGRALYYMSVGNFRHLPVAGKTKQEYQMLSIKDLVDVIYARIAQPSRLPAEDLPLETGAATEFFARPVSTLKPDQAVRVGQFANVDEALRLMIEKDMGSILVCDEADKVLGIFTERDFTLRVAVTGLEPKITPITSVMTLEPRMVKNSSSVASAFSAFSEGKFRHLPICDSNHKPIAVLSVRSFIEVLAAGVVDDVSHKA